MYEKGQRQNRLASRLREARLDQIVGVVQRRLAGVPEPDCGSSILLEEAQVHVARNWTRIVADIPSLRALEREKADRAAKETNACLAT